MTKKTIEKITKPLSPLNIDDISMEEKNALRNFFQEKGLVSATFYRRFFQKGFDKWEIIGIKELKKQFLELPEVGEALLSYVGEDEEKASGYLYILAKSDDAGVFYDCLKKVTLCIKFRDFMAKYGMSSVTTGDRFSNDNWREWELEGVRTMLNTYYNSQKK